MEILQDPVFLSRLQFSVTAMFHILWPLATVGLSLMRVVFEGLWLKTGDVGNYMNSRGKSRRMSASMISLNAIGIKGIKKSPTNRK